MVEYLLGGTMCGLLNIMAVLGLIRQIKRLDAENSLPEQVKIKEYIMFFLCGALSYRGIAISTIALVGLSVYLAFMAYTDYHTKHVYSFFSYLFFVAGACYLFLMSENWKAELLCFLLFGLIAMLGFVVKAYTLGDVEIYVALYPYFMKFFFADHVTEERFLQVISWYLLTLFVSVVTSINIRKFKFNKTKAMAPVISFTFVMAMLAYHYL